MSKFFARKLIRDVDENSTIEICRIFEDRMSAATWLSEIFQIDGMIEDDDNECEQERLLEQKEKRLLVYRWLFAKDTPVFQWEYRRKRNHRTYTIVSFTDEIKFDSSCKMVSLSGIYSHLVLGDEIKYV
jgi:hypothetical protein